MTKILFRSALCAVAALAVAGCQRKAAAPAEAPPPAVVAEAATVESPAPADAQTYSRACVTAMAAWSAANPAAAALTSCEDPRLGLTPPAGTTIVTVVSSRAGSVAVKADGATLAEIQPGKVLSLTPEQAATPPIPPPQAPPKHIFYTICSGGNSGLNKCESTSANSTTTCYWNGNIFLGCRTVPTGGGGGGGSSKSGAPPAQ